MDRGFLDGEWITNLKINRKIDICMPLKSNSEITQFAVAQADRDNCWGPHPTRKNQKIYQIKKVNLIGLYANILGVACLLDLLRKMEKKKILYLLIREKVSLEKLF